MRPTITDMLTGSELPQIAVTQGAHWHRCVTGRARKPPVSQDPGDTSQGGHLLVEPFAGDAELAGGAGALVLVGFERAAQQPGFDARQGLAQRFAVAQLGLDGPTPWEIAIKHPRDRERAIAVLQVSNTALVTSGDYERFFEYEGQRFHHILDPRTGYPSTGAMSATVVAPNAEFADALATALCVMGPDSGIALIESLPRVEAILVGMDGRVHASTDLKTSLR